MGFVFLAQGKNEIKSSPFEAVPRFGGCCGWAGRVRVGYLGAWNPSWSGMEWLSHKERRFGVQCLPCSTSDSLPVVETTGIVAFLCC